VIQSTPPYRQRVQTSVKEPILLVMMPQVLEVYKCGINKMTELTNFKLVNMFHMQNTILTCDYQNSSIDEPKTLLNINLVSFDMLTSRAKPSRIGQYSYSAWCFLVFDQSCCYKTQTVLAAQLCGKRNLDSNFQ
jgi:hypothetical protein